VNGILLLEIKANELTVLFYLAVIVMGAVFTTLFFVFAAREKDIMRLSVRNFSLSLLLYSIVDFVQAYFSELSGDVLSVKMMFLSMFVFDAVYFFMIVCWVFAAENLMGGYRVTHKAAFITGTAVYGICAESIVAVSMSASDGVVRLDGGPLQIALMIMNATFGCFVLYCGIRLLVKGVVSLIREKRRWRVFTPPILFSASLVFYMVGVIQWDYNVVSNGVVSRNEFALIDPATLIYVILCMVLLLFFHAKGYYIMGEGDPGRMSAADIEARREALTAKFGLSSRESEVLALVLNGKSNSAIAGELFISEYTVKRHLNTVFKKTGYSGRYGLISGRM
jgi:DNA-binding CsgD family transcriptional regulator